MKIVAAIAFACLLVLLGAQVYRFWREARSAAADLTAAQAKTSAAKAEVGKLQANLDYLSRPENLEKEVRARFNYTSPGEKLIIIVPPPATSTASSSTGN